MNMFEKFTAPNKEFVNENGKEKSFEAGPQEREMLRVLDEADTILREQGIEYWVVGGWGVEGYRGEVSREHGDIDILLLEQSKEDVQQLLDKHNIQYKEGYFDENDNFHRYEGKLVIDKDGVKVDLVFIIEDEESREIYSPAQNVVPIPSSFLRNGKDVSVRLGDDLFSFYVVSPEMLLATKSSMASEMRNIDMHDVEFLKEYIDDQEIIDHIEKNHALYRSRHDEE